jgi:hypothetical protein
VQRQHGVIVELVRQHHAEVGLAGGGAHRRDVRQRAGQRAAPGVGRPAGRPEPEVRPVDHHVDGGDRERVGAHDGRVVAEPAHDARARAALQRRPDGVDQGELTDAGRRSGRG